MKLQEQLLSKNGLATIKLAKELLKYSIGDRIPTVSEFSESFDLVRGTVQNALKNLVDSEAVKIKSKGSIGSYLLKKDTSILLKYAGFDSLVGAMPLPYSKRYEGLATGLVVAMENKYSIPVNLAYMRGAKNRVAMLLQHRYDFVVISNFAAKKLCEENEDLMVAVRLGPGSFLSQHVIMFHDNKATEITDGMKIGLDSSSIDQKTLVETVCAGKKVEFVELEYSSIIDRVMTGDVDATVMNVDEALDKKININWQPIDNLSQDNTEAVIVVSKDEDELVYLLNDLVDVETVLNIQRMVLEDKITPSY